MARAVISHYLPLFSDPALIHLQAPPEAGRKRFKTGSGHQSLLTCDSPLILQCLWIHRPGDRRQTQDSGAIKMPLNVIEPPKTRYKGSPIALNPRPTFPLSKQRAEPTTATDSGHYLSFASAPEGWGGGGGGGPM